MTEKNRNEPPVLKNVGIVCQQFIKGEAEMPIQRLIDSFLDTSRQYSLPVAFNKSFGLTKRVLARMDLNRGQIAAEVCDAAGSAQLSAMEILCQALENMTSINMIDLLNEEDAMGNTPLSKAVWRGNIQMLEWLTTNGACLTKRYDRGQTVLHQAASERKVAVVEWLVNHGLPIDDKDGDGCTPLLKAARNGRLPVSQWLIENGAVVPERNNSGQTALHLSAGGLRENVDLVKVFIDRGLQLSDKDDWGHTALHCAAVTRHFDTVEFFLKQCYGDDQPDMNDLLVALFAASKADDFMFVEYLAANFGIDLCHINEQGRTALHEAATGDGVEVAKTLLAYRVIGSQADNLGITPIIEASRYGNARVLGCLLSTEWNTENVDLAGRTALHHAAAGGHVDVIDILLYDAEVNCCDKRGWTPLHCAAASGRLAALKMLIINGARLDVETISGKTPLVLAIERGQSDVAAFLMEQSSSSIEAKTVSEPPTSIENLLVDYKEYHLNPSDVHFDSALLQDSAQGTWLGSPIEVKVKKSWQSKNFVEELRQWSALSHPHVVKMYGFCCGDSVDDPFFVYERPAYSSLFEYLKTNRTELWDKLYEAAMGLEYLHDRDIVHGDISCISIAVAANGLAKLKNLGSENDENNFRQNPTWTSPELLSGSPPTFQSDVYIFGLAIVQAFKTAGDVWDIFDGARDEAIRSGKLPVKRAEMTSAQWQLINRMCSFDPNNRLSASDVVRELEVFTHKSQQFFSTLEDKEILRCWANLGDHKILDAITSVEAKVVTVKSILANVDTLCAASRTANDMIQEVYNRLMDIFEQLKTRTDTPRIDLVDRYTNILSSFLSRLKSMNSFNLPHPASIVTIRESADICFSAHGDFDVFMETADLVHSTIIPAWRDQWELLRSEQMSMILKKLENVSVLFKDVESDKEREEAMTYLRFEMANHANSYIPANVNDFTRSKAIVAAFATSKNADWFIPAFEVEFNALKRFNSGSFGSVHRGKWKHAQVVVKKLNLMIETSSEGSDSFLSIGNSSCKQSRDGLEAEFLNEVKIWHKLYHPNVVQLFGACHIGKLFFVCEYAGGGELDQYLRTHPEEILQKLYEAALGLRYLHKKRVVHSDLKCNNILIGSDGLAKLTDFGLSTLLVNPKDSKEEPETELEDSEKPNVGAIRWKAPEVLQGNKATFASDVYSFGMCLLEASSGKFPWGSTRDPVIEYYVLRKKRIPQRPDNCSEAMYELVKRMCRFDASERIGMNEVVDVLDELRSCEDNGTNFQTNIEVSE